MPRRGENIYKRKDGRWEGRYIETYTYDGKAVYKSVYAHSYAEIKEKLRFQKDFNVSQVKHNSNYFGYYAENWLVTVRMKCKISTYNKYRNLYNSYIMPIIGSKRIETINAETVEQVISKRSDLSAKTGNDILCVIKMILSFASDSGCSVTTSLSGLSIRQVKKQMRILTSEEQHIFMEYLQDTPNLYKVGIFLCICTGIRIGELCALKREDISFRDSILSVRKTMQRVQIENCSSKTEVIISEPKSKSSLRDIPIPKFAAEILFEFYYAMKPSCYLLTGTAEKFMEPRALEYHYKKYTKACGLENVNFHALRHTFATRCIEAGFDIKTLSEILGHTNVNITLNRYVHPSMDLKRSDMEKLINVF